MRDQELKKFRKKLNKTQKQMAELLGKSIKAVHSYEQGLRAIPADVERQVLFLVSRIEVTGKNQKSCWKVLQCSLAQKERCPAWEFNAGNLCWFINGTICAGKPQKSWEEKIKMCRECVVFTSLFTDEKVKTD